MHFKHVDVRKNVCSAEKVPSLLCRNVKNNTKIYKPIPTVN